MNEDKNFVHCFGCGFSADVIGYVMLRDRCDFKTAAKLLGAWDDSQLTTAERRQLDAARRKQERERAEQAAQEERERQQRIDARDHLHAVETLYAEAIADHDWQLMADLLPRIREADAHYRQLAGLESPHA